jgi:uncharacterized protein (DUF1800 family)
MGMPLYGCVPPTGYNWQASAWVSTGALVDRMNFALNLAANRLNGITVAWAPAADNSPGSMLATNNAGPDAEELRLESVILGGGVSGSTRTAVLQQFQQQMAQTSNGFAQNVSAPTRPAPRAPAAISLERQDQVLAGLLLGSPEFQRR